MNNFKQSIYKFYQGRYGIDELYKFSFAVFIIIWIFNSFIKSAILYYLGMILCIIMIYRMLSKNIQKRQKENMKYIQIKGRIVGRIKLEKKKWDDRKTHIYRKCPNCKAKIRLPRKKGNHICTCPCCKKDFNIKC